jgi:hypothetical protein
MRFCPPPPVSVGCRCAEEFDISGVAVVGRQRCNGTTQHVEQGASDNAIARRYSAAKRHHQSAVVVPIVIGIGDCIDDDVDERRRCNGSARAAATQRIAARDDDDDDAFAARCRNDNESDAAAATVGVERDAIQSRRNHVHRDAQRRFSHE